MSFFLLRCALLSFLRILNSFSSHITLWINAPHFGPVPGLCFIKMFLLSLDCFSRRWSFSFAIYDFRLHNSGTFLKQQQTKWKLSNLTFSFGLFYLNQKHSLISWQFINLVVVSNQNSLLVSLLFAMSIQLLEILVCPFRPALFSNHSKQYRSSRHQTTQYTGIQTQVLLNVKWSRL